MAGGHLAIATGDLIRIHYTIYLKEHNDTEFASCGIELAASPGNPADGVGLVVFPTWKLTGGGAHEMLPNEVNLIPNVVGNTGFTVDNNTNKADSISFISMEGGGYQLPDRDCVRMVHGSWSYIADQAYTVYELKLYGRGPMVYQGDRQLYVPVFGADRYGPTYMKIPFAGGSTFDFTMSNGQIGIMVMRGDS